MGTIVYNPLFYAPPDRTSEVGTIARIFDRAAGIMYAVYGSDRSLRGNNIEPTIEIARSLYRGGGR